MPRRRLEGKAMSAAEALRAAHAAGVTVMPDGENLVLEAKAKPPQSVLDALSRHKFAILALIRPSQGGWSAEHWRASRRMLAGLASGAEGRSHCGAAGNKHSSMRAQ